MRTKAAIRDERLLKWLRREVNRDLRGWQALQADDAIAARQADLIADCNAKLGLIRWAISWQSVHENPYGPDRVRATMLGELEMIMFSVRQIACGYASHEGWRKEWASTSAWSEAGR
jgi:hypothetical protein